MEKEMNVLYIEGLASHGGPEYASTFREGVAKR
jgi:hypothetical protein